MLERCLSATVINGKTELSIRADTNATEPMSPASMERKRERERLQIPFLLTVTTYMWEREQRSVWKVF